MKRLFVFIFTVLFIFPVSVQAAPKLAHYNHASETHQKAQIIWKLSGLGKPSEQLLMTPDNRLIILTGNKMYCVDQQGRLLWEAKSGSGKMGKPVLADNGSVFTAAKGVITETKLNGVTGWDFTVLPGGKDKEPQMAGGYDNLIYLPLPQALYALDAEGRSAWIFSPWDNADRYTAKTPAKRTFIASAADGRAFYTIYADDKASYKLMSIDNEGKHLWTYWLGDVISAHILPGEDGKIYVTVTLEPSKLKGSGGAKLNQGRIYCFAADEGKRLLWQHNLKLSGSLSEAAVADGLLYVSGGGTIYTIDTQKGELAAEKILRNLVSPVAIDQSNGRVYAGSSEGYLYAVNSGGRLDWSRELEGAIEQAPGLGSDGFIYVCTQKGNLYKIRDNAAGKG